MFDVRAAFEHLNGRRFTPEQLVEELKQIHIRNLTSLPIEFRTEDLYALAQRRSWLNRQGDEFLIQVTS